MAVAVPARGRIGPNAIIQSVAALGERYGAERSRDVIVRAGFAPLLRELPHEMVSEREFRDLALGLAGQLGASEAGAVLERAGALTAGYLLRVRIPQPAQWVLRILPPGPSLAMLLPAIAKNAWTFGESGTFGYTLRPAAEIRVSNRALCDTPEVAALVCRFYRGTFTALLQALVAPGATLRERECLGRGGEACIYTVVGSE